MSPIPCSHCGCNYMRPTTDPEAPKLCNCCLIKEEKRNPKKEYEPMTVDILIKCPRAVQIEIEEMCINRGIDFTKYFLELHVESKSEKEGVENFQKTLQNRKEKVGVYEDEETPNVKKMLHKKGEKK